MKNSGVFMLVSLVLFSLTTSAQDWTVIPVASGSKPSIDLDSDGNPHIAYIFELSSGWVRLASWNPETQSFDTSEVSTGNFYGPPSLRLDQNDVPGINYHRHTPVPEQMYSTMVGGNWVTTPIMSDNHDGWDNSLQYDSNNLPRTSSVDPIDIAPGGPGIEYAVFDGVNWTVEAIGSSQIHYFNGTSLELDASDNPHITYYDSVTDDLMYAVKEAGVWTITTIDAVGDVGRFSSLELDSNGNPRVAYYRHIGDSVGQVKYASWNGSSWDISNVDILSRIHLTPENESSYGAREILSLDLDSQGIPHIAYGDEKVVRYATMNGSQWAIETVADFEGTSTFLGQVNSLALGTDGQIHVAFYERLTIVPITGTIQYATKTPESGLGCSDLTQFVARCVGGQTIQARLRALGGWTGTAVTISIDGTPHSVNAQVKPDMTASQWKIQVTGVGPGTHTVSLKDPAGCFPDVIVDCGAEQPIGKDWDDETSWDVSELDATVAPSETKIVGQPVIGLAGNYPNPFNPSTEIRYFLPRDGAMELTIYNSTGEEIVTLAEGYQTAGYRSVTWNGRNNEGMGVASGMYFSRLRAGGTVSVSRMILLR